ncbi:hypothetical protein [Streptomyces sp. NPDC090036]|uniref:hypothetical protein n=1 Tax=Streptomyces sp. NPDC090036 TaxID=3365926 RepID=UPI0037FEC27D
MGGTQDKRQEPGKGREEQERMRPGQVHPAGQEGERGLSPEELKRRRQEETFRERERDEMRDEEL